jgi:membrane fusion protein (multidrug efflux system)
MQTMQEEITSSSSREEIQMATQPQIEINDEEPELEVLEVVPSKPSLFERIKTHRRAVLLAALVIVAVLGASAWTYLGSFETTDDAQVDGHLHPVSARISGTILRVNPAVEDSHYVEAGTVLAEIDPADYQAEADRAQAEYDGLRAGSFAAAKDITVTSSSSNGRLQLATAAVREAEQSISTETAALDAALAHLAQGEANYKRAETDRQRYQRLVEEGVISQSDYDRIAAEAAADLATINAAKADIAATRQQIAQAQSKLAERKADLLSARSAPQQIDSSRARADAASADASRARAQLTTAQLNLGYTKIIAPVSGIVGRKTVEPGQRVQPGQQLLTIIPVDDLWVTANFKETQLQKMKPAQPVTIHADSTGADYRGHIDSLGGATGSRFSLLPPENASGNYVKVVQRVPVRILLDPGQNADHRLRPGMSVEARVSFR